MEILDKIENPVTIVNQFISSSFGKKWQGNYFLYNDHSMREVTPLNFIGKISWNYFLAGRVGVENMITDGSVIAIFPEYKKEAIEYCKLYENFFKRETKLIITDRSHIGGNKENLFGFKKYSPSEEENELTKDSDSKMRLIKKKAEGIENAVKSLTLINRGTLTSNGYQDEREKEIEYLEIAKTLPLETRILLMDKLSEGISFFKISEEKNPQSIRKYFERFGAPIETISDLELFYESLLEIKD